MPVLILAEDPNDSLIPVQVDANGVLKSIPYGNDGSSDLQLLTDADGALKVASRDEVFEATLSLDDSGAYADGDVLADTQELDGAAFLANGATAILQSIQVIDLDDQAQPLDIVLLRSNVSLGTENSAVSVTDANADEIVAIVEIAAADYVDLANSQIAEAANIGKIIEAASADDGLWIAAISRGTGTYTTSGIIVRVGLLR
jgi:hypothetical protein